ncbi:Heavy metal-associated domain, HMA [Artemisia annua]|uniref:Heavy metal-associated domain, HMA n=1 Tax=Artemisia annua TaxID=35608 RepID=A0A2U1P070_ARTAN|nr:Heavy metal-associated domain, HMA [Artemisia annua]
MVQEIKVKVSMHSEKCRKEVMKAVTKLSGVDEVSVDLPKELVTVIGDVDPVSVATCLRKKRRVAEIVSVGPYKKKDKDDMIIAYPVMYYNNPYIHDGYGHAFAYPPTRGGGGCYIL